jgi:sugar phosphate isomerase/epimerase
MMKEKNRRSFIKATCFSAATVLALPVVSKSSPLKRKASNVKLGLASYSLRKFSQADTIRMAHRAGLEYMCFKSMHLPLDAADSELNKAKENVKAGGMKLIGGGVIYMKSKEQVDQAFEYAKKAGMSMIVGVPNHDLLDYTNQKVKEYDIKVAIHNHGPGDKVYPSPESIYEKVKNLDSRIGICMDIGHTQRIGIDPTEDAKKYFSRLHDVHIKDVDKAQEDGKTVEIGRGIIDIPGFLKTLIDLGYDNILSFEYEKDADDPLPGLCESVGYVKGCLATIS